MADDGEDNTVYVGSKPPMSYVLAVVTQFNQEGQDTVHVKARGSAVATAVDVAEMTRNRFIEDADVDDIEIGTDTIEGDDGQELKLSSIRIDLTR
ncbi:MAG: DNA-binding protein Alba [Candidatus Nanohaloarchaea archaeon]|nr:DNA-binding protein Alba [Candidatus Nanohaloarchaea archaeon]